MGFNWIVHQVTKANIWMIGKSSWQLRKQALKQKVHLAKKYTNIRISSRENQIAATMRISMLINSALQQVLKLFGVLTVRTKAEYLIPVPHNKWKCNSIFQCLLQCRISITAKVLTQVFALLILWQTGYNMGLSHYTIVFITNSGCCNDCNVTPTKFKVLIYPLMT